MLESWVKAASCGERVCCEVDMYGGEKYNFLEDAGARTAASGVALFKGLGLGWLGGW